MKRKILSILLCISITATVLVGCGNDSTNDTESAINNGVEISSISDETNDEENTADVKQNSKLEETRGKVSEAKRDAIIAAYVDYFEASHDSSNEESSHDIKRYEFKTLDINNDGIPELFVHEMDFIDNENEKCSFYIFEKDYFKTTDNGMSYDEDDIKEVYAINSNCDFRYTLVYNPETNIAYYKEDNPKLGLINTIYKISDDFEYEYEYFKASVEIQDVLTNIYARIPNELLSYVREEFDETQVPTPVEDRDMDVSFNSRSIGEAEFNTVVEKLIKLQNIWIGSPEDLITVDLFEHHHCSYCYENKTKEEVEALQATLYSEHEIAEYIQSEEFKNLFNCE